MWLATRRTTVTLLTDYLAATRRHANSCVGSEGFNCAILPAGIDKFDMPVSLIRVAAADSEPGLSMRRSVHVAWQYCGDFLVRVRCLLLGCSMAIDTQLCEATPVPFLLK